MCECSYCRATRDPDILHLISMYAGMNNALEALEGKLDRAKTALGRERVYALYEGVFLCKLARERSMCAYD